MTLLYLMIIFLVICFNVYYDYMLSIARLSLYSSIESYSAHLMVPWVSGKQCVNVVFIQRLPAAASYMPGSVVVRGSDMPVESFGIHPPYVGLVGRYYYDCLVSFLIFLSNVHSV